WPLILTAAVLTLACAAPTPGAPASSSADGPKYGGVLKERITTDPFDWDLSYVGKSIPNGDGMSFAYNSLLGYKYGPDVAFNDLSLRPELAESWQVSPDAETFTFNLKKGVRFAELAPVNGRELTSADVKFSYEYWSRTGDYKALPPAQFAT